MKSLAVKKWKIRGWVPGVFLSASLQTSKTSIKSSKLPLASKFLFAKLGYSSTVTSLETLSDAARFYTNIPERAEIGQHPAFNLVFLKANTISSLPAQPAKKS